MWRNRYASPDRHGRRTGLHHLEAHREDRRGGFRPEACSKRRDELDRNGRIPVKAAVVIREYGPADIHTGLAGETSEADGSRYREQPVCAWGELYTRG